MSNVVITGNASGTGDFTIAAPNSNTDRTLTLPDEAGTVLTSASSLAAANLTGSVASSAMPAGTILQVQTAMVSATSSQAVTAATYAEITGLSVSITPSSASSKILLFGSWMGEMGSGSVDYNHIFSFRRDTTYLGSPVAGSRFSGIGMAGLTLANDVGSTPNSSPALQYLDTPATTSQITYKLYFICSVTSTLYNNRTVADSNGPGYERGMSMITAMEIAA